MSLVEKEIVYIRQPAFLPGLVFFDQLLQTDTYVIYDNVQYERRHFGNRNKIRTPQGWQWLTVPVLQKGQRQQWYMETQIDNSKSWASDHWKAICCNYARAPHFRQYIDFFEDLYHKDWTKLVDLDMAIIHFLTSELHINTRIVLASQLDVGTSFDGKTERLAQIVKALGGKVYITCKGTHGYIDPTCMERHKITLLWHQFDHPVYPQSHPGEFVPNMSAIDLLFNCGNQSGDILKQNMQAPLSEYHP